MPRHQLQQRCRPVKIRVKVKREYSPAFDALPVETRQHIAFFLTCDKDLASYRLVCKSTHDAIDEDEGSFWRAKFLDTYDAPQKISSGDRSTINEWFKKQYQCRRRIERQQVVIKNGNSREEVECLSIVRDLINDSFNVSIRKSKDQSPAFSHNMDRITAIVKAKGLLDCILQRPSGARARRSPPNPLLLAIQLVLSHLALTAWPTSKTAKVWGFPDSQAMVYMPDSSRPMFKGPGCTEVDIEWTLHAASFFKHYLLSQQELVHIQYDEFAPTERPQSWSKPLSTSPLQLGKHWKGCYTYVDNDEIALIRSGRHETRPVQDHMSGENEQTFFQDLCLDFPKDNPDSWPPVFEQILKSRSKIRYHTPTTRAQKRAVGSHTLADDEPVSFCFKGDGEDAAEGFLASGYFNPLPPQQGIPGWHRMTMMKYWPHEATGEIDFSSLWAYEGVVLPGGMIMLGRWWHPNNDDDDEAYSGPFIFWNVDASIPVAAEGVIKV